MGTRGRTACLRAAAAISAAVLLTTLTGCGGETVDTGSTPDVPSALTETPESLAQDALPETVLPAPETGTPTLPPGDPGNDTAEPAHEDEHGDEHGDEHDLPPRTDVPDAAMLDVQTVNAIAGGRWSVERAPADSCTAPRPAGALVTRATALTQDSGLLVQTVSIYADHEAAEEALAPLSKRLVACGWSEQSAPPLGEAATQLGRTVEGRPERVIVVAVEGVAVTVVARGAALQSAAKVAGVVDVAVNSSCAAAADGCH